MFLRRFAVVILAAAAAGCSSAGPASAPTTAPAATIEPAIQTTPTAAVQAAPTARSEPVEGPSTSSGRAASPTAQVQPTSAAPTAKPTAAPSPTAGPLAALPAPSRAEFERGFELLLAADYPTAVAHFERLATQHSGPARVEAQLRLGEALARGGQARRAVEVLEALRGDQPRSAQAEQALYFLSEAEAENQDLDAAMAHLDALARARPDVAPSVRLKQAEWALEANRHDVAATAAEAALKDAQPRLLRIELLEKLGEAKKALGDPEGAYQAYRQILAVAGTTSYLGEQLYNLAVAFREIGKHDEALRALQTAVRDFPRARTAPRAVELLDRIGQLSSVDGYSIGRVRYIWGNYRGAIAAFDRSLVEEPNGLDAEAARLYRALSMMAPGTEGPAIDQLRRLAAQAEDDEIAAMALLEAGKGHESAGSFRTAAATHDALWKDQRLSGTEASEEAAFRAGVAHYMAGDDARALDAWRAYLDTDPQPEPKARALYWSGKALDRLGRQSDAHAAYERAAAQRPLSYFGLRAHRKLHPDAPARKLDDHAAQMRPSAADELELARWFKNRNLDLDRARALVMAEPAMRRAQELVQLGLYREAGWEFEELLTGHREYGDRLYVAADAFQRLGLHYGGAKLGAAALAASTGQESELEVPRALARVAHPLAFADLVWPWAERNSVDPLLLTALMRQESEFDQAAESVAKARGLTQIIPPTAGDIVSALGIASFQLDDLYEPLVSVRFGAYYFGARLRRHQGNPYLALAAYNAGDGNVDSWLRPERVADPDVFAEYIPFDETFGYVRKVFVYWELTRALYAQ